MKPLRSINGALYVLLGALALGVSLTNLCITRAYASVTECPLEEGDHACNQAPCTTASEFAIGYACGNVTSSPFGCCNYRRYRTDCMKYVSGQWIVCGSKYWNYWLEGPLAGKRCNGTYCEPNPTPPPP